MGKYGYEVILHNVGSGLHYHIEPSPSGKRVPTNSQFTDIGVIGTVDVSLPKADFFDNVAQTFGVSRQTAIGGCVIVGLIILTRS